MRTAKDVLQQKEKSFLTVKPDVKVLDALQLMNSVNLSYLVVMDDSGFKGIFCERDYSRNVILKGKSSDQTSVIEVMTTDLPMVELTTTVEQCMNILNTRKVRYLLVFDDQLFQGVITINDLLRQVIHSREEVFD
ncbi:MULTISPECIES: CBS domain-containing protein [unclassified Paraflavitalea]|uniref:CBS domain-containing protein n=1 Tax=unclassified Paraflavitalea TaxID=2798305 RepID=UPI003D347013